MITFHNIIQDPLNFSITENHFINILIEVQERICYSQKSNIFIMFYNSKLCYELHAAREYNIVLLIHDPLSLSITENQFNNPLIM